MNKSGLIVTTVITALMMIIIFGVVFTVKSRNDGSSELVKVGFICDGDESTPFSANFIRCEEKLRDRYRERIEIISRSNVSRDIAGEVIEELVSLGCDIIFTNSFGYQNAAKDAAMRHPDIEFCEATGDNADDEPYCKNYHTFMGRIYEGRYVAGVAAGKKLQDLVDRGIIRPEDARVGYVAAYPVAEVISGYTAFLMGVRSCCPSAVMTVKYTDTWSSFTREYEVARHLIEEGCVIISQHSDTVGPASACEELGSDRVVFHVGYNQSMLDVAPTTSITGTRINWLPYVETAVGAVLENRSIEESLKKIPGVRLNGNDAGAGLEAGWVQMLELNEPVAAPFTAESMYEAEKKLEEDRLQVFKGEYTGHRASSPGETIDLRGGYIENGTASAPSFDYILDDVITIEE